MSIKVKIMGVALLAVAVNSTALTLGRLRGTALVGQPLDLAVQVQLGEGEDAAQCFEAEVLHADTRQDASLVRVVAEPVAPDRSVNVRIVSSSPVDEPVVTVNFRAGCAQKVSRRYVLLADAPRDAAAPPVPRSAGAAVTAPLPRAVQPGTLAPANTNTNNASASADASSNSVKPARPAKPAPASKPAAAQVKRTKAGATAPLPSLPGSSRLKLDPLDLFSDRVANLDSFMTFEPPEDALRSAQRLQALEASAKANQAVAANTEARMADLQRRLEQAESQRTPVEWLYAALALALAALAGVTYLWVRRPPVRDHSSDWLKAPAAGPDSMFPDADMVRQPAPKTEDEASATFVGFVKSRPAEEAPESASPESRLHSRPMSEMDVNMVEMTDSKFNAFMVTDAARLERLKLATPAGALPAKRQVMNLDPEATLDIRQQAEFFESLGQTDRAVHILKRKIEAGDDVNPALYLDLLTLYHSLNHKVDFQHLRDEFSAFFTGAVPEFAQFKHEGSDLTYYPEVVAHISELWPLPEVLVRIEAYMFNDPSHPQSRTFSLAAFRDLMMLHAVAQSMAAHPLAEEEAQPTRAPVNFTDIDFSELAKPPPAPALHADLELDLNLDLPDAPGKA